MTRLYIGLLHLVTLNFRLGEPLRSSCIVISAVHKSRSSTASLSSARFIPDILSVSSIHLFIGRSLFSSSLSVCQHHILFHTICSHHMAKEHQLLVCCSLSQLNLLESMKFLD